ncbi:MAG: hypothetical protein QOH88_1990 [Verrucomicrobiota bacterium]|jgi:hypothetical protein
MNKQLVLVLALVALLLGPTPLLAEPPYYPLIVNGSPSLDARYDKGVLTVRFRRTRQGAGQPSNYRNIPPGSGAWVDRAVNAKEPVVIKQTMSKQKATEVFDRIKSDGGYWRFFCRNTNKGYFEVSRSERANAEGKFD